MSTSVNKVILIGNVGRDPVVRQFPNGGESVSFSVATSEKWNDKKTGELKSHTEWHDIEVPDFIPSMIEFVKSYVKKGHLVYVEGRIKTRKWTDPNGVEKVARKISLGAGCYVQILKDRNSSENTPDDIVDDSQKMGAKDYMW